MNRFLAFISSLAAAVAVNAQLMWDMDHLSAVRSSIAEGSSPFYTSAYESLLGRADSMATLAPATVMTKPHAAPSGDMHDYLSQARYMWPDPDTADGLPYVNRDGISNPEIYALDRYRLSEMASRVTDLTLAWYFSSEKRYADAAARQLRAWMLDPATRMNPNLEYAQVAPGHHGGKGRCWGLIDTYSLVEMLDAAEVLFRSDALTAKEKKQIRRWVGDLASWMEKSEQGRQEAETANNHSVAYDAQLIAFNAFAGHRDRARKIARAVPSRRVDAQILPDGSQPEELKRTLAYHYSQYNLEHLTDILLMSQSLGLPASNALVEKAQAYLTQYIDDARPWPHQQISGIGRSRRRLCADLARTVGFLSEATEGSHALFAETVTRHFDADPDETFSLVYYTPTTYDNALAHACSQMAYAVVLAEKAIREKSNAAGRRFIPRTFNAADSSLVLVHPHDWCSGFFGGSMWLLYRNTHNPLWRRNALTWTWRIEEAKNHAGTHDLGFMLGCTFGNGYALTGEQSMRDVMLTAASTLATRFSPTVGAIRSWDHNAERWSFPVIIDNMMNLELLFQATELTGDSTFRNIAIAHANTTMRNHFRPDRSSYHVVDYRPADGSVHERVTAQGFADESVWARGQAWGLYGFTVCHRYTADPTYLDMARGIASLIMNYDNMPADLIPYWDMSDPRITAPGQNLAAIPRDASAAAITASALYELARYVGPTEARAYTGYADRVVDTLYNSYRAPRHSAGGFLLLHSTGHHPAGSEIDVPLNYADYYYLEALTRRAGK